MCNFIENNKTCLKKKEFGNYCRKHKRLYLINNDEIIINNFTFNIKDYLKNDIIFSIKKKNDCQYILMKKNQKKLYYFEILKNIIDNLLKYDVNKIIIIQKNFRKKKILNIIYSRGYPFFNRKLCNNKEDFYTYEFNKDINNHYFISYYDTNLYWGFDLRTLNKLFKNEKKNPYTTKLFSDIFVNNVKKEINYLKKINIPIEFKKKKKKI